MLTQARLTEIATQLHVAATWVTGTRKATLTTIAKELDMAAVVGAEIPVPDAPVVELADPVPAGEFNDPYIQDSDTAGAHDDTPAGVGG